ncbi:hypothetical protein Tco_1200969 [Tanacetum coccineum]
MQLIGSYGGYNGESGDWAHNLYPPPRHEAISKELSLRLLFGNAILEAGDCVIHISAQEVFDIEAAIHVPKVAERDDEMVQINAEFDFAKDALVQVALRLRGDLFEREEHFQLHFDDHLSNGGSHKQTQRPCFACSDSRHNHILTTNPQVIVPIARFIFHEHVMDSLDISRNPSKEKGKKVASPSVISSSSSSSNDNEAPSFLEFYDELSDSEDLTKAQRENRGMFKCLNRYVGTITKYLEKQK